MSDQPPTDDRDESNDDRTTDDRFADENDHWLASLLSALEAIGSGVTSASRRRRGGRTVFEYDISIRSMTNSPRGRRPDGDDGQSRTRRVRSSSPSSDHNMAIRTDDDELLVVADVAGAGPDDITVGFDDSVLVIAVGGTELDQIEVPWRETDSRATIRNGVLTVRVRPETTGSAEPEAMEDDQ